MEKLSWVFLHGYYGDKEDFSSVIKNLRIHRPDDYFYSLSLEECFPKEKNFSAFQFPEELKHKENCIYVGYSLGGRILLEYFLRSSETKLQESNKLFLLASGIGLPEEQIDQRKKWEDSVLRKIQELDPESFFAFWNSYDIFSHSKKRSTIPTWSKEQLLEYFDGFRLSNQDLFDTSVLVKKNISFFVGEFDEKYQGIYKDIEYNVVKGAGHRLPLDQPEILAKCLLKEIEANV